MALPTQHPATPKLTATDTHNMIDDMRDVSLEDGQPNAARRAAANAASSVVNNDDVHHHGNDVGLPPNLVLHRFTLPIRNAVPFEDVDDDGDDDDGANSNELTSIVPAAAVHDGFDDDDMLDKDSDSDLEGFAAEIDNGANPDTRLRALQAATAFARATSKREVQLLLAGLPRDPLTGAMDKALRGQLRARGLRCSGKGWRVTYLAGPPAAGVPAVVEGDAADVNYFFDRRMEVPEARRLSDKKARRKAARREGRMGKKNTPAFQERMAARKRAKREKRERKMEALRAEGTMGDESVAFARAARGSTRQCVVEARKRAAERAIQEGIEDDERKKASGYNLRGWEKAITFVDGGKA